MASAVAAASSSCCLSVYFSRSSGKTLGIHAFGQVGRNVARIANGFGLETSALDPYCPDDVMKEASSEPEVPAYMLRTAITSIPNTSSATALEFWPGVFSTTTPRALAAVCLKAQPAQTAARS